MTRETGILVTLVIYNLALLLIGLAMHRRSSGSGAEFYLGNRGLGPLVAAISASASSSSAWTLLGVSGAAYAWGLGALWLFPACVGGFLLNWYVLAPHLRRLSHRTGALTVTELLAGRAGQPLRRAVLRLGAGIVLLSLGAYVAAQFLGAGKAFSETFGLSMSGSILIGAAVVALYTVVGGFWAVSVTDTLQGLLMAVTAVLLPVAALAEIGGPAELARRLGEVEVAGYGSAVRGLPLGAGLAFVVGVLGIGLGYPGQPHVVNRFMAARDEAAVRLGRRIAVAWAVLIYAGMLVLGLCGRVLFPDLADAEVVFITATNALFHPMVAGVMIAAVLSAIMSTVDSQLLVAAAAVTNDLGLGRSRPERLVHDSRLVVLLISGAAVALALWGNPRIYSRVLGAWSAMGAAFGPLLLVTVLRGSVSPRATLGAMSAGFGLSALAYAFPETRGGLLERVVPFLVALAIALAGIESRAAAAAASSTADPPASAR